MEVRDILRRISRGSHSDADYLLFPVLVRLIGLITAPWFIADYFNPLRSFERRWELLLTETQHRVPENAELVAQHLALLLRPVAASAATRSAAAGAWAHDLDVTAASTAWSQIQGPFQHFGGYLKAVGFTVETLADHTAAFIHHNGELGLTRSELPSVNGSAQVICRNGHVRQTHRATVMTAYRNQRVNCRVCSMRELVIGVNDLATLFPQFVKWFDVPENGCNPSETLGGGARKYHWKCDNGHRFRRTIWVMQQTQGRCGICTGRTADEGVNTLDVTHPDLAPRLHPTRNSLSASQIKHTSPRTMWWLCDEGHAYQLPVIVRVKMTTAGCGKCTNRHTIPGKNDIAEVAPHLVPEFDVEKNGITPDRVHAGTARVLWWVCPKGHSYPASARFRVHRGTGCSVCNNKRLVEGVNDLATRFPETVIDWADSNPLPPNKVMNLSVPIDWLCQKGHTEQTTTRVRAKRGCKEC
ncbi:zinc-ribbon domain-containing protein [Agromyces mediolanus]|nr:zinc-ribbon domain-containing protein [Agromyces mediolanus]